MFWPVELAVFVSSPTAAVVRMGFVVLLRLTATLMRRFRELRFIVVRRGIIMRLVVDRRLEGRIRVVVIRRPVVRVRVERLMVIGVGIRVEILVTVHIVRVIRRPVIVVVINRRMVGEIG